jgi:hypothetical protein
MAFSLKTQARIAEMEAVLVDANSHMEAAVGLALGYTEAGCPPVTQISSGDYVRDDALKEQVPRSWSHAYITILDYKTMEKKLRAYKHWMGVRNYSYAKSNIEDFDYFYKSLKEQAEKTVASS